MSALKFLSKKSWHTATIRNNEKVWLREQEAAREQARTDELQKQLAEERRQEELEKLEEANGLTDGAAAQRRKRINWMYEYTKPAGGPDTTAAAAPVAAADTTANATTENDATAKQEGPDAAARDDVLLGRRAVDASAAQQLSAPARAATAALVDAEAKLREDPLVAIQLARARALGSAKPGAALRGIEKSRRAAEAADRARDRARRKEERRQSRAERRARRDERATRTASVRRGKDAK